ncbi:MAG: branched-chain amino acid transporter permease [Eubacteriales bacterium]
MPISVSMSLITILIVGVVTFLTRATPFLLFPEGKEIPPIIQYLGKVLTPAVIGMLVVYCLKGTTVFNYPHGIPEAIAVITVIGLHVWKRNNLLSIGIGTVLYMFLIQVVF